MKRLLLLSVLCLASCSSELEKPTVVTDRAGCYAVNFGGVISSDTCMKKKDAEMLAVIWYTNVENSLRQKEKVRNSYKEEGK